MLASEAPHLRLKPLLTCIFVSWICSAKLITPSLSAGDASFVPFFPLLNYHLVKLPFHYCHCKANNFNFLSSLYTYLKPKKLPQIFPLLPLQTVSVTDNLCPSQSVCFCNRPLMSFTDSCCMLKKICLF